jgi:hypothetical protein
MDGGRYAGRGDGKEAVDALSSATGDMVMIDEY